MVKHLAIDVLDTEESRMARALARSFVDNEIMPVRQQIDDDRDHTRVIEPLFRKMMLDLGMGRVMTADQPANLLNQMGFLEELSRGDSGIAVAMACTGWCLFPIRIEPYKRMDLIQEMAVFFPEGEVPFGCFAMTEPEGGCDIENPRMEGRKIHTTARLDGEEWVINGVKQWPTNSGISHLYLVVCTTDPGLGEEGIALIYVPHSADGVSFGRFENKAGMQADRNCTMFLDNVRVPKRYRAAGPGDDANLLHQNLVLGSIASAAMSIGTAQNIFEIVTDYASQRVAGGKPIKEHSIIACTLADMVTGIEMARTYALSIAYMWDRADTHGPRWSPEMLAKSRVAKTYAADMSVMVANKAMEMMGSYGYTREGDVEKHWRDNKMMQQWLGGSHVARLDIARHFCNLQTL